MDVPFSPKLYIPPLEFPGGHSPPSVSSISVTHWLSLHWIPLPCLPSAGVTAILYNILLPFLYSENPYVYTCPHGMISFADLTQSRITCKESISKGLSTLGGLVNVFECFFFSL